MRFCLYSLLQSLTHTIKILKPIFDLIDFPLRIDKVRTPMMSPVNMGESGIRNTDQIRLGTQFVRNVVRGLLIVPFGSPPGSRCSHGTGKRQFIGKVAGNEMLFVDLTPLRHFGLASRKSTNRFSISAWIDTSSDETDSSQTINSGSEMIALAILMR